MAKPYALFWHFTSLLFTYYLLIFNKIILMFDMMDVTMNHLIFVRRF